MNTTCLSCINLIGIFSPTLQTMPGIFELAPPILLSQVLLLICLLPLPRCLVAQGQSGFAVSPVGYPPNVSMINLLPAQRGENRSGEACSVQVPASIHRSAEEA